MPGYGPGQGRPAPPSGMGMSSPMTQQSRRIDPDQIPSPVSQYAFFRATIIRPSTPPWIKHPNQFLRCSGNG
jgi:hypothetical protein